MECRLLSLLDFLLSRILSMVASNFLFHDSTCVKFCTWLTKNRSGYALASSYMVSFVKMFYDLPDQTDPKKTIPSVGEWVVFKKVLRGSGPKVYLTLLSIAESRCHDVGDVDPVYLDDCLIEKLTLSLAYANKSRLLVDMVPITFAQCIAATFNHEV